MASVNVSVLGDSMTEITSPCGRCDNTMTAFSVNSSQGDNDRIQSLVPTGVLSAGEIQSSLSTSGLTSRSQIADTEIQTISFMFMCVDDSPLKRNGNRNETHSKTHIFVRINDATNFID